MSAYTTLTRKGQITIPAEIRETLGLKRGDRVAVSLEDGKAVIERAESAVARSAGIFNTGQPPPTAEELREAAERAIAEDVMERMRA